MTAEMSDSPLVESRDRAVALIEEGNALEEPTTEAMALYDAAVRADPKCARANLNRGNNLAGIR
jgi:hypothetical protein